MKRPLYMSVSTHTALGICAFHLIAKSFKLETEHIHYAPVDPRTMIVSLPLLASVLFTVLQVRAQDDPDKFTTWDGMSFSTATSPSNMITPGS